MPWKGAAGRPQDKENPARAQMSRKQTGNTQTTAPQLRAVFLSQKKGNLPHGAGVESLCHVAPNPHVCGLCYLHSF